MTKCWTLRSHYSGQSP